MGPLVMNYLIRGRVALVLKLVIVSLLSAILLMLTQSAFAQREYVIAAYLAITVFILALTYLTKISIPLKFFIPGILLLTAFVIGPILYTVAMSGFNYKTGNIISKEEAINLIKLRGTEASPDGLAFDLKLGKVGSEQAILVSDITNLKYFVSTGKTRTEINPADVTLNEYGVAISTPSFIALSDSELSGADKAYSAVKFKYDDVYFIALEGLETGIVSRQVLKYEATNDQFVNLVDGTLYRDNGRGNYSAVNDETAILEPGWRAPIWFENYSKIFTDPRVREPLVRILIWGGMFNTEFGAINTLFGSDIAWFSDPNFARTAVILVNLWLGFPYFYLISSGSLQAIPSELQEAAAIDGANPRQIFRKITLPLLLQILSPLLIDLDGEIAGATDILISYTYKIAFGSSTQDLGLASAISLIIFVLVGSISLYSLRKSKVLESFA
jgi:arabinogalactan oligomer/maltooligosaccharide transport system permease protein